MQYEDEKSRLEKMKTFQKSAAFTKLSSEKRVLLVILTYVMMMYLDVLARLLALER